MIALGQFGHDLAQPFRPDGCRDVHRMNDVGEQHRHLLVLRRSADICERRAALATELGGCAQLSTARPTRQSRRCQCTATLTAIILTVLGLLVIVGVWLLLRGEDDATNDPARVEKQRFHTRRPRQVGPYFIWPNLDPFKKQPTLLCRPSSRGHRSDCGLGPAEKACDLVAAARDDGNGRSIFGSDPLRLQPLSCDSSRASGHPTAW